MEQNLTFDELPKAVTMLTKEVNELKRILIEKNDQRPLEPPDKLLTIEEAAEFLHLTKATLYRKVSRGELNVMKRSKRLYFSTEDLTGYIKAGRKKTNAEIEAEAESYLKKKGGSNE